MASKWWGPANSVWSDDNLVTGNWYSDSGLTIRTTKPGTGDTAWFGATAGDCQLDEAADLSSIRFDQYSGYAGTFEFVAHDLTFRSSARFYSPQTYTLTVPAGRGLIFNSVSGHGTFYSKPGAVWPKLTMHNPTAANRFFTTYSYEFTVEDLVFSTTSTGQISFYNDSGKVWIQGYSIVGTGHATSFSSSSVDARAVWWQTDVDINDFEEFDGYMRFGYDRDVAITLPADLVERRGIDWHFENHTSSDVKISILGTGYYHVTKDLYLRTYDTGDLTVDWSGADLSLPADFDEMPEEYISYRDNDASRIILDFGDDNDFGAQNDFDFTYVSEFQGGTSTLNRFTLQGDLNGYYQGPRKVHAGDPVPTNIQLPGSLLHKQYVAGSHNLYLYGGVDIAGDVTAFPQLQAELIYIDDAPAENPQAIFRGKFIVNNESPNFETTVNYSRAVAHYDDLDVTSGGPNPDAVTMHFEDETIDFYGSLLLRDRVVVDQENSGLCRIHVPRKADRKLLIAADGPTTFGGTWEVYLDDPTNDASAYDFLLESLTAAVVSFGSFKIYNELDAPMLALFQGSSSIKYTFSTFDVQGRGDPCVAIVSDEYAVSCRSHSVGTPWRFTVTSASHPGWTKFRDTWNDVGAGSSPVYADDRTCFDDGNNTDITFDSGVASMAICPVQAASFFAYRYSNLPPIQSFQIVNISVGELNEPTASGLPAWLNAAFVDNGDGTWTMLVQPSTTDKAEGVYTASFDVAVEAARRSPQSFSVEYTTSEDIIPLPTPTSASFYLLRAQTYPAPQTIDVDNTYPAGGALQQIVVTGLPTWLDIEYTVPGPADHQEFKLTVNAIGLALAVGTYSTNLSIDAPNAAEAYVIPITLVVDEILIDTDKDIMEFSMKVGGTLPYEDVLNVSNSGTAGTLAGVTAVSSEAWLDIDVIGDGIGNNQNILVVPNAGAQALAAGVHTAQITIDSTNADNLPYTVDVELTILVLEPFILTPSSIEFTPGRDWELPAAQQVVVAATGDGTFVAPVTVTGAPAWLQVTIDALVPTRQIITLTPLEIPTVIADFDATLIVTGSYALELPVSMVVPAFFRRPDCQMDFIPRIEGTLIEECEVPPAPPPAPVLPPIIPPQPAPTYPKNITMTGPPCVECETRVEYDDQGEVGYGKPHYYIECDEHGCLSPYTSMLAGTYPQPPGGTLVSITIDECGHICALTFSS